jgi:heptaprenyl diphosphate synthase
MGNFWDFCPPVEEGLEEVNRSITAVIEEGRSYLGLASGPFLAVNGKSLRPGLLILASLWGASDKKRITAFAAALELLHLASLIHDDVVDNSDTRRSLPSVHKLVGKRSAVLLGDYIFSRCLTLAGSYSNTDDSVSLSRAVSLMAASELVLERSRYSSDVSIRRYLKAIAGKTAGLFALSLFTGAREAGLEGKSLQAFRRLGYNLGIIFQIQDDLLDLTSAGSVLGKPAGQDISRGYYSLPVIYGLLEKEPELVRLLKKSAAVKRGSCSRRIISILKERGYIKKAESLISVLRLRISRELLQIPEAPMKVYLEKAADRIIQRQN